MPSFPIVDSHVHLYDPSHLRYSWLKRLPKIDRRYDLSDLDRCRDGVEIDKIVFAEVWVDPGLHLEEAAWVQSLGNKDPRLVGMVAHAPLEKGPAVEADLEKLKGFSITRGVRRLIEIEMDPGFCLEPAFIKAVKLLPRYGLTFDICVKHWALVFGLELAPRCPEVEFVPRPYRQARHQARPQRALEEPDPGAEPAAQRHGQGLGRDHRGGPPALEEGGSPALCRACARLLRL